jgi:hypothetical protein
VWQRLLDGDHEPFRRVDHGREWSAAGILVVVAIPGSSFRTYVRIRPVPRLLVTRQPHQQSRFLRLDKAFVCEAPGARWSCWHRAIASSRFSPERSIAIGRSALRGRWAVPMTRDKDVQNFGSKGA